MKVRPITVMVGLAALIAVAAVTVAWLPDHQGTTVGRPSSLPISLGYGTASAMAPVGILTGSITYVRGPGLVDLSTAQEAWTFAKPKTTVPPAGIGSLARALGVAGAVKSVDGGWQTGPDTGPALRVSSTPGFNWTYENALSGNMSGGVACSSVSSSAAGGSGSTPSVTAPWMTTPSLAPSPSPSPSSPSSPSSTSPGCEMPAPPAGVPDQATAEASARRVLRAAGLDPSKLALHTTADAWTATATATPVLDGTPTVGIDTTISFGGGAAVEYASGWLGTPTRAETYPLIGIDAAIDRLNRGVDLLGPQMMGARQLAGGIVTEMAPADRYPGATVVPEPMPIPGPTDRTVTITSSTVVLVALPGRDSTTWMVPAYELRTANETGRWWVLGVDESFVAPPSPNDTAIPPGSIKPCPPTDPNAAPDCIEGVDGKAPTTGPTTAP